MARTAIPGAATLAHRHRLAHDTPDVPREGLARPVTMEAAGDGGAPVPASSQPGPERGPRLAESIAVLRKLWTGEAVSHHGRFFAFEGVRMLPAPRQAGGPPIWCGGRSDAALRRTGRVADGWLSYVVTPETYASSLAKIALAAATAGRSFTRFGTGHLLFTRLDDTYEKAIDAATETLSVRYAMDFRQVARRYAALGTPDQVA